MPNSPTDTDADAMPDDDEKQGPVTEKSATDIRQPTNPAVQAEMMAFLHAPVTMHRERRPAAERKVPPKRSS